MKPVLYSFTFLTDFHQDWLLSSDIPSRPTTQRLTTDGNPQATSRTVPGRP